MSLFAVMDVTTWLVLIGGKRGLYELTIASNAALSRMMSAEPLT